MKYIMTILVLLAVNLHAKDMRIIHFNDLPKEYSSEVLVYPFYPRDIKGDISGAAPDVFCVVGYTKKVRDVSQAMKNKIYKAYGIPRDKSGDYEVDHFVSLQLGGSNSLKNLFPQPYEVYLTYKGKNVRMGAREKDVVETKLKREVCKGHLTQEEAVKIITTNWVGYYLKLKRRI
jgi:hypothetical protein